MRRNKKKLSIIVFSLFIIQFSILNSQDTWARSYAPWGDSQFDSYFVDDVVACQDGGFALNGTHIWYDGSNFEMNPYMIKTDSEGNVEWAERDTFLPFDTCSHTLLELDDGSFITSGFETSPDGSYLLKRNAVGDTLWTMPFYSFIIQSMQQTNDGNLILSGKDQLAGLPGIRKITTDGETIWTNSFMMGPEGTTGDHSGKVYSIVQTYDNGFATIGSVIGMELWNYDFFLLKTDSAGDSLWSQRISDDQMIGYWAFCLIEDNENNLFFDYFKELSYLTSLNKYTSDGDSCWSLEFPTNNFSYSLLESEDNNYILYGQTIIKMTPDNQIIWEKELPGNYDGDSHRQFRDGERSIKKIDDGYICTRIIDGVIGLIKMNLEGEITETDNTAIPKPECELNCYPNPFNPSITISFNVTTNLHENTRIEIYNIKGQKVDQLRITNYELREHQINWNAENHTSGIYFVNLIQSGITIQTKKITLIK